MGTFLDIEGALSNTPPEVIGWEALKCVVPRQLVDWIQSMLQRRHQSRRKGTQVLSARGRTITHSVEHGGRSTPT